MNGVKLIAAEQNRQRDLGFNAEHDQSHIRGDLATAGAIYAMPDHQRLYLGQNAGKRAGDAPPFGWPWTWDAWKPSPDDRIKELVKAGALIASEIDRLLATKESA